MSSSKNSVAATALPAFPARRRFGFDASIVIPVITGLIVIWLVALPLVALFYVTFSEDTPFGPGAFTLANFADAYHDFNLLKLFANSFIYAVGSAFLSFVIGAAVAYVVERTDAPFRGTFHILSITCFALPGLLVAMAWTLIASPNIGWANALMQRVFGLSAAPFNIYSMGGMIWALASHNFPLVYMLMAPAFRLLDARLEEAALVSGAQAYQVAARVTLPLLRPAILSTLLLLFIRGIESFEVPRIIGMPGHIAVFTAEIQDATSTLPPRFGAAGALSLTLVLVCLLSIFFYRRATRAADAFATLGGKGHGTMRVKLGAWRWPLGLAMAAMFAVILGLPLFTLFWQSFFHNVAAPQLSLIASASLENYRYLLSYPVFREAAFDSLGLGVMAATIVVLLTFVMAAVAQRAPRRLSAAIDALLFAPVAIPSVIIGAAILFAYLMLPIPIYNTIWILLIAYLTLYLPYGMRFAASGLAQINRELEEIAQISGANLFHIFRRVLMPLLAPVLVAAWLYIFVLVIRELSASIFLAGPHTHVLATVSLTLWEGGGSIGAVCALGVLEIVPLVLIVLVMRRLETARRASVF
jgi:iron(III) transport system permease protein